MSEEGISEQLEALQKKKKEPDYRVEDVNRTEKGDEYNLQAQLESEKKRREDLETVVELEAYRQFERDRDNLLKNIPSEMREKIKEFIGETPERIEQVKASLILAGQDFDSDDDEEPEKTIAGKATLIDSQNHGRETGSVSYANPVIQQYSDLYGILRSPTSSAESKAEAEQLLDDAFVEIGNGLRSRSRNNPYSLPHGVVTHCFSCGGIVESDLGKGIPCPHCGHRFGIDKFPRNPKFQPT